MLTLRHLGTWTFGRVDMWILGYVDILLLLTSFLREDLTSSYDALSAGLQTPNQKGERKGRLATSFTLELPSTVNTSNAFTTLEIGSSAEL